MDDEVMKLARAVADAVSGAIEASNDVRACRERACDAGYDVKISVEATFTGPTKQETEARRPLWHGSFRPASVLELSSADRRFLRSLRILGDEAREEV